MTISTGIEILDGLLKGGLKQGSSVLIMATPGVEDLQFAHQCLFTHLNNGGNALYVVNNKKPAIVRAVLDEFDWNVTPFEKKGNCAFLDAYTSLLSLDSPEKNFVARPNDLEETNKQICRFTEQLNQPRLIILDSLSSLIDITNKEEEVIEFTKNLLTKLKDMDATLIALFTHWPYRKSTIKMIQAVFDCVIMLKAIERRVILRSYFSIEKAKWTKQIEKRDIPYKVVAPGGVKVFIPKLLITGPFNAGKTSFIHSVSTRAVSVDRLGTTVALDHGHVDFRGFAVDLFGTPGQERFDPIMEMLGGESLGVIIVIDSTDPRGFARAQEMLKKTKTEGLPAIVVANKANLKGALKPEKVRVQMNLPDDIPIVPVVADDLKKVKKNAPCKLKKEDVETVLEKLFQEVI